MNNPIPSFGVPAIAGSVSLENSASTGVAARRLGVTSQTIRDYIRAGRIRAYRVGPRNYRIPMVELERVLAEVGAR